MRKKKTELNILGYTNYRELLKDYFEERNAKMRGRFSYRMFAKRAGFGSPNYIPQIIQGRKNLSHDGIHRLCEAMELTVRQREFFEALVFFNQAKTPDKRDFYLKKIFSFREFAAAHLIDQAQYEYFSKWYIVAVRELVSLPNFKMNLFWIAKKLNPSITEAQAKEAIEVLQQLEYIKQDEHGKWIVAHPHLKTTNEVRSSFAFNFHQGMITQAAQSLKQPARTREISSVTMSISSKQFNEIKGMIAKFRDDIQKYLDENPDAPSRVCQLNYQLFHLTEYVIEDSAPDTAES